MRNRILSYMLAIALLSTLNGCGSNEAKHKGRRIVARINRYELTADDFRNEANLIMVNKYFSGNPAKIKEDLLDEMIDKKILIQEAERLNFDKDAAFMKEIERYWEQALLKLLIKEKMEELSRGITVSENEVREEYNRMAKGMGADTGSFDEKAQEIKDDIYNKKMQDSFDAWMRGLRMKAGVKIYKENL